MNKGDDSQTGHTWMMTALPDEELMLQVRNGAGEGLSELFDRYQSPLYNFYAKMTGDRGVSEDLVQEVFLRILKYRRSYTPGHNFRAWVYQIARNARVDHCRKQRPQVEFKPEMAGEMEHNDLAQLNQETSLLHRALMRLPEEKREILVLSRLQEMKYKEIAKLLGCEVGTVKVRVHRALQDLKQVFQQMQMQRPAGGNAPRASGGSGASL